jgi:regulator of replication initiation timing
LNVSFKDEQGATGKPFLTTLPRSRVAAATETNVDRRTTAVMAHAQLKGVVEGVCAASVVAESLASLDPLRLEGMGVAPNDAVRLYKAVYKYARVSVASLGEARDALQEMGHGGDNANARGELLGHLWHLYASAWEGACGESFPSRVVQAKALAPALRDARNAVEVLTSDLETTKQALLSLEEEALEAQVEADALRPSVREAETQRARAENAERLLLAASARGDAFELELATTSVTLQRVLGELDAAKVASCESEKRLSADALDAAKAAKAELAATLEKNAFDLIAPHKALADTVLQRDAALAGERDAKKVTSVLKADVAFLREKRSGAHDELHVALLRAREAEDRQDVSVRVAKTAKHEASVAVEKCAVAENSASGLRENVSGLEKELTLAKTELHQLKQKVNLLEGEDVRVQLKLAKGRAELAERELGEAKQTRTKAVDRCKQLVTDMERADKERRSALRVAKKAETFALELEKKVRNCISQIPPTVCPYTTDTFLH